MSIPLDLVTAHHEAAHAVVTYRTHGYVGAIVTIVPTDTTLGRATEAELDSFNADDMVSRVLSCYAGGYAQRRVDPTSGDLGCETDEAIAADVLARRGWQAREHEFRDRARELVDQHWPEIVAVAAELLRVRVLDDTETELIADIARGDDPDATPANLARYRATMRTRP